MMMIVLRKSTRRPLASDRCPSSRIWRRMLKTSGCAFSTSSRRTTAVVLAADRLGQLAALVEADVAGRRADEAADVVALHELAHVDLDERVLAAEHELGERLGELRLPDAGRAEEDERADRALRVLEAGAGAADGLGDDLDRLLLADDPLVEVRPPSGAGARTPPGRCA